MSTFPIDVRKTQSTVKNHLRGGEAFLPLPHPSLAKFDEYLTNSHIFNLADLSALPAQTPYDRRFFNTAVFSGNPRLRPGGKPICQFRFYYSASCALTPDDRAGKLPMRKTFHLCPIGPKSATSPADIPSRPIARIIVFSESKVLPGECPDSYQFSQTNDRLILMLLRQPPDCHVWARLIIHSILY
jgi:hypothetical protein